MARKNSALMLTFLSALISLMILMWVVIGNLIIDSSVSSWAVSLQGSSFDSFFIFLGYYSQIILIGIALIFVLILYSKRRKESIILFFSLVSGYVLEQIIKLVVQRPRPSLQLVVETGYGFPSGHSVFSVILFGMLIYFYKDKIKSNLLKISFISLNVLLVLLVGFSRIYLNVHSLTDVVGGFALGLTIVGFAYSVLKKHP